MILPKSLRDELVKRCIEGLPNEVAGFVAGSNQNGLVEVSKIFYLTNIHVAPEKFFSFDRDEVEQTYREMLREKLQYIGSWHSHPITRAWPSDQDLISQRQYKDPHILIYSVSDDVLRAYELVFGDSLIETKVEVI